MGKVSMAGVRHGWARPSGMLEVAGGGAVGPRLGGHQAADSGVANTRAWLVVALAGRQAGTSSAVCLGMGSELTFFLCVGDFLDGPGDIPGSPSAGSFPSTVSSGWHALRSIPWGPDGGAMVTADI